MSRLSARATKHRKQAWTIRSLYRLQTNSTDTTSIPTDVTSPVTGSWASLIACVGPSTPITGVVVDCSLELHSQLEPTLYRRLVSTIKAPIRSEG